MKQTTVKRSYWSLRTAIIILSGVVISLGVSVGFSKLVTILAPDITSSYHPTISGGLLNVDTFGFMRFIVGNTGAVFFGSMFLIIWIHFWLVGKKSLIKKNNKV